MTTPNEAFSNDFSQLGTDAGAFNNYQSQLQAAQKAYTDQVKKEFNSKDPELVFMSLILMFSNAGFTELDAGLAQNGGALQVQGDVTKLGNDLENLTHPPSTDANDPNLVRQEAAGLNKILDLFNDKNPPTGKDGDWYKYVASAIGGTGTQALGEQYLAIRQDIHIAGDNSGYNPPANDPTQPNFSYTYHFDPDSKIPKGQTTNPYITSFGDLQAKMAQQGDPDKANESAKLWTDAFNTNTATTQSVQSSTNEVISNDTNTIKTFQAFVTDMMHAVSDVMKG